jgi:hypothetical protein
MRLLSMFLLLAFQRDSGRLVMMQKVIEEANPVENSHDPFWWLNSGGYYFEDRGIGRTVHGELPEGDKWRALHDKSNPRDTEQGKRPQNIFRLVTKGVYASFTQEVYFNITTYNLTDSPERAGSNGILFFSNYQDGDNLYYSGIRVDGRPVQKKKIGPPRNSVYHNLAYPPQIFPGVFDRETSPNLLPIDKWIGLRNVTTIESDGSVSLRLYIDKEANSAWELIAESRDDGGIAGPPFPAGRAGIRSDFMDLRFRRYKIENGENR